MTKALSSGAAVGSPHGGAEVSLPHGLLERVKLVSSGALAAVLGLLPHVLHHAGPLAGAALFAGAGGSILFGAVGLVAATPFLIRLHRRTGGWRVPGGVLALMVVMFSISALVIGPRIAGGEGSSDTDQLAPEKTIPGNQGSGEAGSTGDGSRQPQPGHDAHH